MEKVKRQFNILYFGMIAEVTGKSGELLEMPPRLESTVTVSELEKELLVQYPGLKQMSYKIAVNQKVSTSETPIQNEDEVAVLPPFAGG